jgi:hypothetical protein
MAVPVPSISCCISNHHNLFYQIQNALAFNRNMCCHLPLCLPLLPFHSARSQANIDKWCLPPKCARVESQARTLTRPSVGEADIHIGGHSYKRTFIYLLMGGGTLVYSKQTRILICQLSY